MTAAACRLAITVLSLTGWIGAALPQTSQSADDILLGAAQYLSNQTRGDRLAIDPRERSTSTTPGNGSYTGMRPADRTRALAERLGARVQSAQSAIRCTADAPRRCTLGGLERVIALSEPIMAGDNAIVHASVSSVAGPATNRGVSTMDMVLTLTRTQSGWRVIEARVIRTT